MLPTTNYGNQETTLKTPAVCWPFLPGASGSRHVSLTQSCHGSTWRSTRRDLRNPSAATWSGWFLHQDATWPSRLGKGGEQVEVGEFPREVCEIEILIHPGWGMENGHSMIFNETGHLQRNFWRLMRLPGPHPSKLYVSSLPHTRWMFHLFHPSHIHCIYSIRRDIKLEPGSENCQFHTKSPNHLQTASHPMPFVVRWR